MSFSHCLVLVQTSIPITLLYTFFFGTDDWLDITIISILTLVLGYLIGSPLYMSTLLRFYCGTYVTEVRKRVMKSIIIFDIENDPRCMAVRECLSIIDAPILVYPVPLINKQQSIVPSLPLHSRFLHEYRARSGQQEVKLPFMEDPNTGVQLCGDAEDIVMYLYVTYCRQGAHMDRQPPLGGGTVEQVTASLVQKLRSSQPYGTYAQPSLYNRRPLRLFAHEGDADSKRVRERLCSLQLHYECVTCAQGGAGRAQLVMETGHFALPVLHDAGTGVVCEGAEACIKYLDDVYAINSVALGTLCNEADMATNAGMRKETMFWVQESNADDSDAAEEGMGLYGDVAGTDDSFSSDWGEEDEDEDYEADGDEVEDEDAEVASEMGEGNGEGAKNEAMASNEGARVGNQENKAGISGVGVQ